MSAEAVADDGYVMLEFAPSAALYVHLKLTHAWTEGGVALFEGYEAPTLTTGSTAFVPVNRRRVGTPPASGSTIKTGPTGVNTAGATLIRAYFVGGGGAGGGSGGLDDKDIELVLKPSTTYLFRLQNLAGSAKALSLWLFWYEEGASGA